MAAKNGDWETNRKLVLDTMDRHGKNITDLYKKVDSMNGQVNRMCGAAIVVNVVVGVAVVLLVAYFKGGV